VKRKFNHLAPPLIWQFQLTLDPPHRECVDDEAEALNGRNEFVAAHAKL
jgi:hypothetical protein